MSRAGTDSEQAPPDYGAFVRTLRAANILDERYPVTGCYVWLPDGYALKRAVFDVVEAAFERVGYEQYEFPRLVPGSWMEPVSEHIAPFEQGCYWLRAWDGTQLDLYLTPTGETSVYRMFREWIRDESDLPIRLYQVGHMFRPHRRGSPLVSGDEFMALAEAHGAFATREASQLEYDRVCEEFVQLHEDLGIPCLPLRRPTAGNLPVYDEMMSFETFLPSKRRSFNVGIVYHQGTIYSEPIGVTFRASDGSTRATEQITFGISERAIAAMLDLHKDAHGLRMLPRFAPTQVLILPILKGDADDDAAVLAQCRQLAESMPDVRVAVDDRGARPIGKRMAASRQRGVPIRIGVTIEDVRRGVSRVYLRTEEAPREVASAGLAAHVAGALDEVDRRLRAEAAATLDGIIDHVESTDDLASVTASARIASYWTCDADRCATAVHDAIAGEVLGTHASPPPFASARCIACGEPATQLQYASKRTVSP